MAETYPAQGTPEWHKQRLGKATASRFSDMMTNGKGTGSMGQTAFTYMYDLIAERLTGQPADDGNFRATEWGHENEPEARAIYCLLSDVRVTKVGFLVHPDIPGLGGSPDALVDCPKDGPGGVEIKCPFSSRIHLQYVEGGAVPKDYYWQVQGLMCVTKRKWWDFCSFDRRMPEDLKLFVVREYRDDDAIADLERRAKQFLEQIEVKINRIRKNSEVAS